MTKDLQRRLERLHPDAWGWAIACCRRNPIEAEDVLQASYLKILEGRARFDERSSFRTWLFGVIRRTAAEQRRAGLLRVTRLRRWFASRGERSPHVVAAAPKNESQTTRALHDALERLSRRQREVMHLVFYQELTVEQAAAVMGVSIGSARTHYQRGKARLRVQLAGTPADGDRRRKTDPSSTAARLDAAPPGAARR